MAFIEIHFGDIALPGDGFPRLVGIGTVFKQRAQLLHLIAGNGDLLVSESQLLCQIFAIRRNRVLNGSDALLAALFLRFHLLAVKLHHRALLAAIVLRHGEQRIVFLHVLAGPDGKINKGSGLSGAHLHIALRRDQHPACQRGFRKVESNRKDQQAEKKAMNSVSTVFSRGALI